MGCKPFARKLKPFLGSGVLRKKKTEIMEGFNLNRRHFFLMTKAERLLPVTVSYKRALLLRGRILKTEPVVWRGLQ